MGKVIYWAGLTVIFVNVINSCCRGVKNDELKLGDIKLSVNGKNCDNVNNYVLSGDSYKELFTQFNISNDNITRSVSIFLGYNVFGNDDCDLFVVSEDIYKKQTGDNNKWFKKLGDTNYYIVCVIDGPDYSSDDDIVLSENVKIDVDKNEKAKFNITITKNK